MTIKEILNKINAPSTKGMNIDDRINSNKNAMLVFLLKHDVIIKNEEVTTAILVDFCTKILDKE